MPELADKHCMPCQGGTPPLTRQEIDSLLIEPENNWTTNNLGHLYKSFKFKNFMDAMELANKVSVIAEEESHHPNISISWGGCAIEIWTHKIDGLTESDFVLAAKIDSLA